MSKRGQVPLARSAHTGHCGPIETATNVDRLRRRGLLLAGLTIAWNVVEALVAIGSGIAAGSIALVGFGFDSTIEVMSSVVVVWQFRAEGRSGYDEARERLALRLIAVSFFVLAGYITFESIRDLFFVDSKAAESTVGIVLAALSLAVMPVLALAKRRTADELGSPTLRADSRETLLCAWLSATLLVGLVLNAAFGWSWADPLAALAIAAFAVKEGVEAWRGDDETTRVTTGAFLEQLSAGSTTPPCQETKVPGRAVGERCPRSRRRMFVEREHELLDDRSSGHTGSIAPDAGRSADRRRTALPGFVHGTAERGAWRIPLREGRRRHHGGALAERWQRQDSDGL